MKHALFVGAAVLAMSAAPALAQTSSSTAKPAQKTTAAGANTGAKAGSDQHFVMEAAKGGLAEVELGKLAKDKASSDQVKQFAQRMVDDHSKANDELKSIAQNKNITLPTNLDAKDKALQDRLSKLSGEQFDKMYMQHMLQDHRKDVAAFRTESKSGKDPDVKAFAAKTLPTLEEHLKQAQDTNKAVGTSGSMSKGAKSTKGTKGQK
jgi:putative membrane protein